MKKFTKIAALLMALAIIPMAAFAQTTLNRNETVYGTGGLWSAPLELEPIPIHPAWPSPAPSASSTSPFSTITPSPAICPDASPPRASGINGTTYQVKLRQGVKWSDGKDFSADDVVFTFTVAKGTPISWSTLWDKGGPAALRTSRRSTPIPSSSSSRAPATRSSPRCYIRSRWSRSTSTMASPSTSSWPTTTRIPSEPAPTSICRLSPIATSTPATTIGGASRPTASFPAPKNIVLLMVNDNSTALGMLLQGVVDFDNNYTPGTSTLQKNNFPVTTFYKKLPYHLSWNTTMLYMNNKKKPLNDAAFRRAIAYAIDTPEDMRRRLRRRGPQGRSDRIPPDLHASVLPGQERPREARLEVRSQAGR